MNKKLLWIIVPAVIFIAAIGSNPRMIEELQIGGGYSDADGGVDLDKTGNVSISGDLTIDGDTLPVDITASGEISAVTMTASATVRAVTLESSAENGTLIINGPGQSVGTYYGLNILDSVGLTMTRPSTSTSGPLIRTYMEKTSAQAAEDLIFFIDSLGRDSAANSLNYVRMFFRAGGVTNNSEWGYLHFNVPRKTVSDVAYQIFRAGHDGVFVDPYSQSASYNRPVATAEDSSENSFPHIYYGTCSDGSITYTSDGFRTAFKTGCVPIVTLAPLVNEDTATIGYTVHLKTTTNAGFTYEVRKINAGIMTDVTATVPVYWHAVGWLQYE